MCVCVSIGVTCMCNREGLGLTVRLLSHNYVAGVSWDPSPVSVNERFPLWRERLSFLSPANVRGMAGCNAGCSSNLTLSHLLNWSISK